MNENSLASILDCYLANLRNHTFLNIPKSQVILLKLAKILVDKNYKPTDPRTSMNLKHKKHEEDYLKSHLNQLLKQVVDRKSFT